MADNRDLQPQRPMDVQEQQRQAAREATAAKPARELDETTPGGRYRTDSGDLVDANGKPVQDKG